MAVIRPFRAVRPRKDLASQIAALPYDVYSREEARKVVEENPLSFLKIDRAETQLEESVDLYSSQVYECAANTLSRMIEEGEFVTEESPCLYLYELTMDGRTQTGFGACVSVAEYESGIIKKHENTRQDKEDDRTCHVEACGAQTGPIFLAYRWEERLADIQEEEKKKEPLYDFVSPDGIRHRMWRIEELHTISRIQTIFADISCLYIADGHHRAASAVRAAQKMRSRTSEDNGRDGDREYEYFLSVIFSDRELMVMDYNRWVKDLGGLEKEEFLKRIAARFRIQPLQQAEHPGHKGQFAMYLDHRWYLLEEKQTCLKRDVVENLDVSVLQDLILFPVLGIQNPKTDQRISFIGGIRGLGELEKQVDENGGVAFAMYPTAMNELFEVADAGCLMPPKSTWFEPKLRSGLLIHKIRP